MEQNKRNLIQVLEEQNNPNYIEEQQENNFNEESKGDFEEEIDTSKKKGNKVGKTQSKVARREAQKEAGRGTNTDLLRLEKNYFDGIYHEDKYENMNDFLVKKLNGQSENQKQKPLIGFQGHSDSK